jgi:hypothetical protein
MPNISSQGTIYLSGGMEKAKNHGLQWRTDLDTALHQWGYTCINITAYDHAYVEKNTDPLQTDGLDDDIIRLKSVMRTHFIEADLDLVKYDTDLVVLYYDESVRRGAGSHSEAMIAYEHDIPVFVVNGYDKVIGEIPKWLIGLSTKIFPDFDSLTEYLNQLSTKSPGILRRDIYGNRSSGNKYLCSMCGDVFNKAKHHFVSKVSPMYCKSCVDVVATTNEGMDNRYQFFKKLLHKQLKQNALHPNASPPSRQ